MAGNPEVNTAVFDGLIEGPLPPFPDGEERLRQWVEFARSNSVPFQLSVDGPAFSLLAESKPVPVQKYEDIQSRTKQAIEQLLEVYPQDLRARIFSTVQTTEYREDEKVQSIYTLTLAGVQVRERKFPWDPGKKPQSGSQLALGRLPLSPKAIAGVGVLALAAIVILFIVVDVPGRWAQLKAKYFPLNPDRFEVDGSSLAPYVTVERGGVDTSGRRLIVTIRRGDRYPADMPAFRDEEARLGEEGELKQLLKLRKLLVDGNVRVSYLDKNGKTIWQEERSVRGLLDQDEVSIPLPVRSHPGTVKLLVGY